MSHKGPSPPGYNPYDYTNRGRDSLSDTTASQVAPAAARYSSPHDMADNPFRPPADAAGGAPDNADMADMPDSGVLGSYGDMPMNIDSAEERAIAHAFDSLGDGGNVDVGGDRGESNDKRNPETTEESVARAENQFNTAANNVPGAGPLPPGSFAQMSLHGGNTLTEFTKRRNWPAKVVEELKDFLQILDANGRIKYASASVTDVTGYAAVEMEDLFLKDFIHPDDQGVFVSELNESIASGNTLRMFYRFKKKNGEFGIFETVGHAHIASAKFAPNPNNKSPFCQAVFIMSRPYPTTNSSLLDSFLEHKIENERLKRRIAELRREEEADADESQRQGMSGIDGPSDRATSEGTGMSSATPMHRASSGDRAMVVGDESALNAALTRENLEGNSSGSRPDSLRDKMARYEGTSHADTIEMLTGLRYVEGERSRGITTGNASPTLIRGDAGIAIPVDRDSRGGDKKKKLKTSEEYVCTDCGTLDSPEWRKGPSGPKTLCNACGLRWAKKEKKRSSNTTNTPHATSATDHPMN